MSPREESSDDRVTLSPLAPEQALKALLAVRQAEESDVEKLGGEESDAKPAPDASDGAE